MTAPFAHLWYTASELAGLPGLPAHPQDIPRLARQRGWRARRRNGRGGGIEYHLSSLPSAAQDALVLRVQVTYGTSTYAADALWRLHEMSSDAVRAEAQARLAAVQAVVQLVAAGMNSREAIDTVAAQRAVGPRTLYRWRGMVRGYHESDWLAVLTPRYAGNTTAGADISPEAWDYVRADYLRPEAPGVAACYERLRRAAAVHGWKIPSARTIYRRLAMIPAPQRVLARKGAQALKAAYPAQRRDRSVFEALEAVNADGHTFDVFVRWPDGTIGRPVMIAWQDIMSGKLLAHRVDRTEHTDLIRLAFGDMVERWGIPRAAYLDNGHGFASKWLTGGQPSRYRFKIRAEDPVGIMTQMGVEVTFVTPYHGQAKPIERAFRDLCEYVAKHPAFAGAYTGNSPAAKPENYRSTAVPIERFLAVLEQEIAAHNARPGRRSPTCRGRSFDETFAASYERAPVRRATAEQRRLWLLAAEGVSTSRVDGSVSLAGNRYWCEALARHAGERVVVRFDPDQLHTAVHVYTRAGVAIGEAACIQAAGFNDTSAAREHARARRTWMRAQREQLAAERRMSALEAAQQLPVPEAPEPAGPQPKVVRPAFRGGKAGPADYQDTQGSERRQQAFRRAVGELAEQHKRRNQIF